MPIYYILIFSLAVLLISIAYWLWKNRTPELGLEQRNPRREKLSAREFYERYFEQKGIPFYVVLEIREIFESRLGADFLSVRPDDDDFWGDLSNIYDFTDPEFNEIIADIESRFDIKISDREASGETGTIGKMINLVWRKIREKENP
jgi:hypothetical protein